MIDPCDVEICPLEYLQAGLCGLSLRNELRRATLCHRRRVLPFAFSFVVHPVQPSRGRAGGWRACASGRRASAMVSLSGTSISLLQRRYVRWVPVYRIFNMSYYSGDICNMSYYGVDDYNAAVSWYVRRRRGMDDGLLTYNITGLEAIRAYVRAYVILRATALATMPG